MISKTDFHDIYRMPGEFESHKGTFMIWPVRPGSFAYEGKKAKEVFTEIALKIAEGEELYMLAGSSFVKEAAAALGASFIVYSSGEKEKLSDNNPHDIYVLEIETDDAWARDTSPVFVKRKNDIAGVDFSFNAWGGEYDGLYSSYKKDDAAAGEICRLLGYDCRDAKDFVLEGGSVHSDGEGTLIVTGCCLLSKGRNPGLSKEQIEKRLCSELGAKKVIWLPEGIYNDETNGHVDNICAFVRPGEVVLAWTDDESDPQYALSCADLEVLENETDALGRRFKIHKLPIPSKPVCVRAEDLEGLAFEEGEDTRETGERLAASYVNFYISNKTVIYPRFDDKNDDAADKILKECFPDREVFGIYARDIINGGGNIHCITMQLPG